MLFSNHLVTLAWTLVSLSTVTWNRPSPSTSGRTVSMAMVIWPHNILLISSSSHQVRSFVAAGEMGLVKTNKQTSKQTNRQTNKQTKKQTIKRRGDYPYRITVDSVPSKRRGHQMLAAQFQPTGIVHGKYSRPGFQWTGGQFGRLPPLQTLSRYW